jgi:hypothetical protein
MEYRSMANGINRKTKIRKLLVALELEAKEGL